MRKLLRYAVIAAGIAIPQRVPGQSLLDQVNFKSATLGGVRLYGVSVYSGYLSSAYPLSGGLASASLPGLASTPLPSSAPLPEMQALGADENYGVQASLGWQHHAERSDFALLYSGGYSGIARYSVLNALNQSISLNIARHLSQKWTLSLAGEAQDSTLAQFLYQPSSLSVVAQLPATFDDLAAAFSIGQFSNAQMASMLTTAPVLESPLRTALLGNRVLSYAFRATVAYAYSSRLSFRFGSISAGAQNRPNGQDRAAQQTNYAMPRSIGANAGMEMSYLLSPRTEVGLDAEEMRIGNRYQTGYTTTASAFLGRKMGTHWFLRTHVGGSLAKMTQHLYGVPTQRIAIGGGSVGFRTYQHTLVAFYDRASIDAYGFAAGVNTTLTGSWNWHRPGARWSLFTSFGQQQMRNTGYVSISGWQSSTGFSESLNGHTTLTAQYVYLSSAAHSYLGGNNNPSISSVRISLNWSPEGVLR
jgi:hypothetical protein